MIDYPHNPRLSHSRLTGLDRLLAHAPGWIYLVSGLTILALAMLMPAWTEAQHLAWQKNLMQQQADRLTAQASHYQQFHLALTENDPILLEHLAFTQLRLKPVGTELLIAPQADSAAFGELAFLHAASRISALHGHHATVNARDGAVDATLASYVPRLGVDVPVPQAPNTRLVRLTHGRSRIGLVLVALTLILAAVWAHKPTPA